MNYAELKRAISNGEQKSIYLLQGEDTFFSERALFLIKNQFVKDLTLDYAEFCGDNSMGEIVSSVSSYPFISDKRVTVVKEFYPKPENIDYGLKAYLENPCKESVLVIVNTNEHEPFAKFSNVVVVDCNKADSGTIVKWIKATFTESGVNIDGETAKILTDYCRNDMTRISLEVEKLASYCGNGGTIKREDVELMVSRDSEYKIYEMTDCIARKNFNEAITIVNEMLSRGDTPQKLLSSMYNYFRRLLHSVISDLPNEKLAKSFGVKEFAVKKMQEQANKFKKRALKNAVDMLVDIDYKVKSGEADVNEQLYIALFNIMIGKKEK